MIQGKGKEAGWFLCCGPTEVEGRCAHNRECVINHCQSARSGLQVVLQGQQADEDAVLWCCVETQLRVGRTRSGVLAKVHASRDGTPSSVHPCNSLVV